MNATEAPRTEGGFDLFRLTKSKRVVDLSPNTLRDYSARGLKFYRCGKPVYISKTELAQFIRDGGPSRPYITKSNRKTAGGAA